eukprot:COSAG06_NODE_2508_length_6744_cov_2.590642_5_plen_233_part_00
MLPVALMLLPIPSGSPAPQQQPSDLSLAQRLSALNFNHLGTVSSCQRFEYLSICSSIQGNASFVPCSPMTNGAGCVGGYLFDVGRNGTREDTPPIGMRSANPLGGFGTGFFRLAADGSVRDWELDNSVAGATTITPTRPEMLLGVRVNGRAATLRTHPITPEGAAAPLPGVATLRYSASTLGQGWGSAKKPVIALLRAYPGRSRRSDACWSRTGTGQCTGTGCSERLRRLAV